MTTGWTIPKAPRANYRHQLPSTTTDHRGPATMTTKKATTLTITSKTREPSSPKGDRYARKYVTA